MGGISSPIPTEKPGDLKMHAVNAIPYGWLKANGAAVSRSVYAALFDVIGTIYGAGDGATSFNLPDLRGEFPRGFDDGRGVDAGRVIGSAQAEDIGPHAHPMLRDQMNSSSSGCGVANTWQAGQGSSCGTHQTQNSLGTETRPRNIAVLMCIKF